MLAAYVSICWHMLPCIHMCRFLEFENHGQNVTVRLVPPSYFIKVFISICVGCTAVSKSMSAPCAPGDLPESESETSQNLLGNARERQGMCQLPNLIGASGAKHDVLLYMVAHHG